MRKHSPIIAAKGVSYGGIIYSNEQFMTISGQEIRLTPMQFSLLQMFFSSETHTLSKQEICDCLWPKKPDTSDTLYTLIRRIQPIIEANSGLRIESDGGRGYSL
jgi:DNA-binding response OmpR family regulator